MDWLWNIQWHDMFIPKISFIEIFIRGTCIYLALFLLLRTILKRQAGQVSISDLLVIVLIADATQNGMSGSYQSLPEGILLAAVLIFWNFILEWIGYRFPRLEKLIYPPPLPLIKNGRINRRNMRYEFITEAELYSQLRQHGVEKIHEVKKACLEGDGKISIITYETKRKKDANQQTNIKAL